MSWENRIARARMEAARKAGWPMPQGYKTIEPRHKTRVHRPAPVSSAADVEAHRLGYENSTAHQLATSRRIARAHSRMAGSYEPTVWDRVARVLGL